jgi:hypothetical protein
MSRRSVLRHGLFALGAAAGVVGLTGTGEKIKLGALPAPSADIPSSSSCEALNGA